MIICDIDGCIFDNGHRAHLIPKNKMSPHDWAAFNKACLDDLPIMVIIKLVKYMAKMADGDLYRKITFVTSRGENSRDETTKQLEQHFPAFDCKLLMRSMDDHRSTVEYKRATFHLLSDHITSNTLIIDDHPGVIKMVSINYPQAQRLLVESFDCALTTNKAKVAA